MHSAEAPAARRPLTPAHVRGATIVVMYHYIRPIDRVRWRGVFPLEPAEFEAQLDFLSSFGVVVHPDAIDDAPADDRPRIVLTFDDGTRDHYETAFPILRRRGLSGLFGVLSGPAHGEPLPNPHLVHWLTSQRDDAVIWHDLCARFGEAALGDAARATALYVRDDALRARVKFALNFALDYDAAQAALIEQVRALGADPVALARRWFVTDDEIVEMHQAGMAFAIHGHAHRPYRPPAERFVDAELAPCAAWLTRLVGVPPRHYIAAFGGSSAGGDRPTGVADILAARGCIHGYLTASGVIRAPNSAWLVPRVDAADLPPRKSINHLNLLLTRDCGAP